MTLLNKKLRRETNARLDLDRFTRGRPIIVELEPPDLISFKFKGQKKKYTAPIARLMQSVIVAEIEAARRRKA